MTKSNPTCFHCGEPIIDRKSTRFCSDRCRWTYHQQNQQKDKADEILSDDALANIASKYKQDFGFISRLYQTSRISGFSFDLLIRKYCERDQTILIPEFVQEAHKKVMDNHFRTTGKADNYKLL